MTLSELKNGMVVETRNGDRWLVIGDLFVSKDCYNRRIDYAEDLRCKNESGIDELEDYDIVKVYDQYLYKGLDSVFDVFDREYCCFPIWEGNEKLDVVTLKEAVNLLKKQGYKIDGAEEYLRLWGED